MSNKPKVSMDAVRKIAGDLAGGCFMRAVLNLYSSMGFDVVSIPAEPPADPDSIPASGYGTAPAYPAESAKPWVCEQCGAGFDGWGMSHSVAGIDVKGDPILVECGPIVKVK